MKKWVLSVVTLLLTACAAHPLNKGAESVELVTTPREVKKCTYLGEVVGSQGNRFTGGFTPNENLMIGARNAIKNEAQKRGGTTVLIQQQHNAQHELAGGTANSTLIGKAYKCGG
ncbi:MAG: DUF4156 domain-containing protein [Methylococcaceae bacterium]|jgi:hypothetical protein